MISSVQNPTIKALLKLKQKKYRQEERAFLVEGEHLVSEAFFIQPVIMAKSI